MTQHTLVIRNGTIVDGTGRPRFLGDLAIDDGVITAIGDINERGITELDATGLLVTPGWVDIHTHYDGQVSWDPYLTPSSWQGVTTAVMGNCGVGFAPVAPDRHDWLIEVMEGIEDIPGTALHEGITWDWESFPEYLDSIDSTPHAIDFAAQIGHAAVRGYVMGDRGANREVATADDLAGMSAIIREAVSAGALGFATSRTAVDRRNDGEYIASFDAGEEEIIAAAQAVKDSGGGMIQMITELGMTGLTPDQEFGLMRAVSHAVGLPITYTMVPGRNRNRHFWHDLLRLSQEHNREGGALIHPQYFPRPVGMLASFDLTSNPFVNTPAYKALAHLPLAERIIELRKPEVRARILADDPDEALLPLIAMTRQYDVMFELGEPPCYEPEPGSSIAERAVREGRPAPEVAYDLLLENDGKGMLYVAFGNWPDETLDHLFKFFDDPNSVMGLGDGGAHYELICDSSYPTFVLSHWARDRKGRKLSIEQAVRAMTSHPAGIIGLNDRGVIAPGYKANINVIDHAGLTLHAPEIIDDLPGGGRRLDQRASGYRYMLVSGAIVTRDDQPTGVLPGKLVRGMQSAPAELAAA